MLTSRLTVVVMALLLVVAAFSVAFIWLARDSAPPLDEDLEPRKVTFPPEHNALPFFEQSREYLSLSDEEQEIVSRFLSGDEGDAELVAVILQRNQPALLALEEGLTRSGIDWEDPKESLERRDHLSWRKLALLLELESSLLARGGDSRGAIEALFHILRFGQMLEQSGLMIDYLVGLGIKESGLEAIRRTISTARWNQQEMESHLQRLDRYDVDPGALAEVFRREYVEMLELMEDQQDLPQRNYLYQPNNTKRLFAAKFRSYIENLRKHCSEIAPAESDEASGTLSRLETLVRPNSVGRVIYQIATPAYEKIIYAKCRETDNLSVTGLFLALKDYKDRNGRLPPLLSDLVPTYFETLPLSAHDGWPFHYSAVDGTLSYFYFGGKGGVLKEEELKLTF